MPAINKKVCMLGEFSVGKTSLVRRFVYDRFDDDYVSTVGVKVSRKTLAIARPSAVVDLTMMLWDLAGTEAFDRLRVSYLRGSSGAILVCDLTQLHTLRQLLFYVEQLHTLDLQVPLVIAANKADLEEDRVLSEDDLAQVAERLRAPCFLTSAKEGDEVETVFRELGRMMLAK